ncbi:hypothetical protein D3C83_174850 [compost metagenome]
MGSGEDVGSDDFVQQPGELGVSQPDVVEGLELFAKILLQRQPVANVRAMRVLEVRQLADDLLLEILFACHDSVAR